MSEGAVPPPPPPSAPSIKHAFALEQANLPCHDGTIVSAILHCLLFIESLAAISIHVPLGQVMSPCVMLVNKQKHISYHIPDQLVSRALLFVTHFSFLVFRHLLVSLLGENSIVTALLIITENLYGSISLNLDVRRFKSFMNSRALLSACLIKKS